MLVKTLIPAGLRGLILAAMAAALMSHSLLDAQFHLDHRHDRPLQASSGNREASEEQLVRFGQWSGVVMLMAGIADRRSITAA